MRLRGALYCTRARFSAAAVLACACWWHAGLYTSTVPTTWAWALIACCSWCMLVTWGCCGLVARCLPGLCAPTTHVVLARSLCSRVPAAGCIFLAGLVGKAACASLWCWCWCLADCCFCFQGGLEQSLAAPCRACIIALPGCHQKPSTHAYSQDAWLAVLALQW